jgi:hypothetical protein
MEKRRKKSGRGSGRRRPCIPLGKKRTREGGEKYKGNATLSLENAQEAPMPQLYISTQGARPSIHQAR